VEWCQVWYGRIPSAWWAQISLPFYAACEKPLIIDAGANIGAASVWFALTYPKATIVAVEPDRDNFELLKRNTIGFPSVLPINAAIASETGTLYLSDPGQGAWAYRTASQPSERSYSVPAITIDDLMNRVEARTPFILKIDIEGAELDLFSQHTNHFDSFPIVAIELHDWMLPREANSRNFLKWHALKSRDFVFRGENAFSIATEMQTTLAPVK
jgi:FkbM family methyltransferase